MGRPDPRNVYSPDFDKIDWYEDDFHEIEESYVDNQNELSPFEIQYLSEYSTRDTEETLFYEQGEPL